MAKGRRNRIRRAERLPAYSEFVLWSEFSEDQRELLREQFVQGLRVPGDASREGYAVLLEKIAIPALHAELGRLRRAEGEAA